MSVTIPLITASGAQHEVTLPDPAVASGARPSTPANLVASAGSSANSVKLDWSAVTWSSPTSTNRVYEVHEDLFAADHVVATVTAPTRTSGSLASGNYRYFVVAKDSAGASAASAKVTVTVPIEDQGETDPPPTNPPPSGGNALFVGDYSTGDLSQWTVAQLKGFNSSARNYGVTFGPTYSLGIVNDPVWGKVARYEVRNGDNPGFSPGTDRSEVQGGNNTGGNEGQTRWYRFQTKFDANFPKNHRDLGWGVVNQWHGNGSTGSPPVCWGVDQRNGYWSLVITKQSSTGQYLDTYSILDVPLGTDWHDIKMRIVWSASDTVGSIQLWRNGVRQTFLDGTQEHKVRTMIPGQTSVYYKEGYYRKTMSPTGIVYHTGYRVAASEADLG